MLCMFLVPVVVVVPAVVGMTLAVVVLVVPRVVAVVAAHRRLLP